MLDESYDLETTDVEGIAPSTPTTLDGIILDMSTEIENISLDSTLPPYPPQSPLQSPMPLRPQQTPKQQTTKQQALKQQTTKQQTPKQQTPKHPNNKHPNNELPNNKSLKLLNNITNFPYLKLPQLNHLIHKGEEQCPSLHLTLRW